MCKARLSQRVNRTRNADSLSCVTRVAFTDWLFLILKKCFRAVLVYTSIEEHSCTNKVDILHLPVCIQYYTESVLMI